VVEALPEKGYIYSKPTELNAIFDDYKLIVTCRPEIWNPSTKSYSFQNQNLNFGILFSIRIINDTIGISYNETTLTTLLAFNSIPSGLSKQNLFTATYTFSRNFNINFQKDEFFKATIDIITLRPYGIDLHSSINGTSVNINNNNISITTVNPENWGNVSGITFSFSIRSIIPILLVLVILKRKNRIN